MTKQCISNVPGGPPAIGPYSPVVMAEGKVVVVSGQIPFDPEEGKVVRGSIGQQTQIVLTNLKRALEAGGATLDDVISCRVYLQGLTPERVAEMNEVYATFFGVSKPARATVGVELPGFDVEIEALAVLAK